MNFKRGIATGQIVVLILVIALAGTAIYYWGSSSVDIEGLSEQEILDKSLVASLEKESFHTKVNVDLDVNSQIEGSDTPLLVRGDMTFEGDIDFRDSEKLKVSGNFKIGSLLIDNTGPVDVELGPIDIDYIQDSQDFYFRINESNLGPFDVSEIAGEWIHFNQDEFREYIGESEPNVATTQNKAQKEIVDALMDKVKNIRIYDFVEELQGETLDSTETLHYKIAINKEGVTSLITTALETYINSGALDELTEEGQVQATGAIDQVIALFRELPLETIQIQTWIGKTDLFPRKNITIINLAPFSEFAKNIDPQAPDFSGSIKITTENSEYGKRIRINKPKTTRSAVELFDQMFGAYIGH